MNKETFKIQHAPLHAVFTNRYAKNQIELNSEDLVIR